MNTDEKENKTGMEYQETWTGLYQGVRFRICKRPPFTCIAEAGSRWTFYLLLLEGQFDDETWKTMIPRPRKMPLGGDRRYYARVIPIIDDLEWHGERTWFERHFDQMGRVAGIEGGCDYMHLMDEGRSYSLNSVTNDVKRCIESLCLRYPALLAWRQTDGAYVPWQELEAE